MDSKKIAFRIAGAVILVTVWLYWWLQPERQLRRAQGRLIAAVEKRDFDAMARLLAEDYRDRWGHDKAIVVGESRQVFSQFLMLTIERESRSVEMGTQSSIVREKLTIEGFGGPLAVAAKDAVNALREPFSLSWRRRSWKPWDWELLSVEQPELRLPE